MSGKIMGKFSILMNCYNCEKYLKEALDSIFSQTFQSWEIVFVDNCSTDRSSEIAKSYGEKLIYRKTDNLIPLGEARNFGLQYCNSEYLAFLDTDDIWFPEKLATQFKIFEKDSNVQMIYGGAIWIDEVGKQIGERVPKKSKDPFKQNLIQYEINMQSVAIRKNIEIDFRDDHKFSPDFDLFMKILSKYKTEIISESIVKYRKLTSSLTSKTIDRWWVETKESLDDIFQDSNISEKYIEEKKLAYAKVQYYKAQYLISKNRFKEARKELKIYSSLNKIYKILYFLSFSKTLWKLAHKFKR